MNSFRTGRRTGALLVSLAAALAAVVVAPAPSAPPSEAVDRALRDERAARHHGHDRQQRQRPRRRRRPDRASQTGATFDGATGYNWVRRAADEPAAVAGADRPGARQPRTSSPGNGTVHDRDPLPDQGELRQHHPEGPGRSPRAASGRSRTRRASRPACSRARGGQVATGAMTPLNDNAVARPHLRADVDRRDDVRRRRRSATARTARPAPIDNAIPMTIGGKIDCDQIDDHLRLLLRPDRLRQDHQGRQPAADGVFDSSCSGLTCAFDSSASADADGSIARYAWDFGDGAHLDGGEPVAHLRRGRAPTTSR